MLPMSLIYKKTTDMPLTDKGYPTASVLCSKTDTALKSYIVFGKKHSFTENNKTDYSELKPKAVYRRYNLIFDANGGCEAPADFSYAAPVNSVKCHTFLIPKSIPYRNGYIFKGWSLSPDSKAAQYQPESSVNVNASTVLYAVWEKSNGIINADATIKLILNGITISEIPNEFSIFGTATDNNTGKTVWCKTLTKEEAIYNVYDNSLYWVINAELLENHTHIWNFAQSNNCIDGYELSVSAGPIYTGENFISGTRCITNTYIKKADSLLPYTKNKTDYYNIFRSNRRFYINTPLKKSS